MTDERDDELVTIEDGAARLGVSERTVWGLLRTTEIVRYRRPGHGKTTFVRWGDLERAYRTPRPINPPADGSRFLAKKAAA